MKRLLLLGALALFAFTSSAQSDTKTSSEKEKIEKVCAKTGEKCSETCAKKKTGTCCEGKKDSAKKACCSKDKDKKSCSKDGDKSSCSKTCTKTCAKTCAKTGDSTQSKGDKKQDANKTKTKNKTGGLSK